MSCLLLYWYLHGILLYAAHVGKLHIIKEDIRQILLLNKLFTFNVCFNILNTINIFHCCYKKKPISINLQKTLYKVLQQVLPMLYLQRHTVHWYKNVNLTSCLFLFYFNIAFKRYFTQIFDIFTYNLVHLTEFLYRNFPGHIYTH